VLSRFHLHNMHVTPTFLKTRSSLALFENCVCCLRAVYFVQAFAPRLALPGRSKSGMEAFRQAVVAVTGEKVGNGDVISFEVSPDGSIDVYASMGGAAVKKSSAPIVDKVHTNFRN